MTARAAEAAEAAKAAKAERVTSAGIIALHVGSSGNVRVLLVRLSNGVECLPRGRVAPFRDDFRSRGSGGPFGAEALRDTAARALWCDTGYAVTAWLDAPATGFAVAFARTNDAAAGREREREQERGRGEETTETAHFFPALVDGRTRTDPRPDIASARWYDLDFCLSALSREERDAVRLARQSAERFAAWQRGRERERS